MCNIDLNYHYRAFTHQLMIQMSNQCFVVCCLRLKQYSVKKVWELNSQSCFKSTLQFAFKEPLGRGGGSCLSFSLSPFL